MLAGGGFVVVIEENIPCGLASLARVPFASRKGGPLCPSGISPASGGNPASSPPLWIPAFAGMTEVGRNDVWVAGMTVPIVRQRRAFLVLGGRIRVVRRRLGIRRLR